jgi:dihydrofolate reductase
LAPVVEARKIHRGNVFPRWPNTRFLRALEHVAVLKQHPGIYLMEGARITATLIDARLVDELRLIVYPLIEGKGKALFATIERHPSYETFNSFRRVS